MTLTLDIQPELEAQLQAEAAKAGLDTNTFILNALGERLHQRQTGALPPHVSREEAELLQKINAGLPEEVWQRYRALIGKRRAETLTPEEHTELIALSDQIEEANARRIEHLAELARLRNTSLEDLMQQLEIKPRQG